MEPKERLALLAPDLRQVPPRSPRVKLGDYVIAARTLDKCRATLHGTAGDYHFDCPLDNLFFEFTGLTADRFREQVARGATDAEMGEWIAAESHPRERIAIIHWNNRMRAQRLVDLPDAIQEFMEDYIPANVPAHLQNRIHVFFDIYDAEEGRF